MYPMAMSPRRSELTELVASVEDIFLHTSYEIYCEVISEIIMEAECAEHLDSEITRFQQQCDHGIGIFEMLDPDLRGDMIEWLSRLRNTGFPLTESGIANAIMKSSDSQSSFERSYQIARTGS